MKRCMLELGRTHERWRTGGCWRTKAKEAIVWSAWIDETSYGGGLCDFFLSISKFQKFSTRDSLDRHVQFCYGATPPHIAPNSNLPLSFSQNQLRVYPACTDAGYSNTSSNASKHSDPSKISRLSSNEKPFE